MDYIRFFYRRPRYNQTIFLDKDGVLNKVIIRNRKLSSPQRQSEIKIIAPSCLNSLLKKKKFNLVIVSNQPDLSRGIINEEFLKQNVERIRKFYPINLAFFCPHLAKDACKCRKPKSKIIKDFRKKYPYAIKKEYFIGDTDKDYYCAKLLKIKFYLVIHRFNKHFLNIKASKIYLKNLI